VTNNNQYECIGFHDALPKGKSSGTMVVDQQGILFNVQQERIRLPLQNLQVSLGGASNRLVFFEHPLVNGWSFYTSDLGILRNSHLGNQPAVAALFAQAKRKRVLGWGAIGVAIALILMLILRMDLVTGMIAKKIPVSWEQQLGESTIAQYQLGKDVMDKKESDAVLDPLTESLISALDNSPYQYQFHIVNDGSLNAFALPGGEVMIHSALILRAESAEELLGVMAHEIIHVEQQHGLRGVIGATGIYVIASAVFGDVSGIMATLTGAAPLLLNQSYSRRFETESDLKGFALLQKANINPVGLASFFEKMIEEEKKQLEKIEGENNRELVKGALQFLSTHPASEERIQKLNELATNTNQADYQNLETEFSALQAAVKNFVNNTEGENNNEE
jgi:beta-barrel assembly-enhancing protease